MGSEKVVPDSDTPKSDDSQIGSWTPVVHQVETINVLDNRTDPLRFDKRLPEPVVRQMHDRMPKLVGAVINRHRSDYPEHHRLSREDQFERESEQNRE